MRSRKAIVAPVHVKFILYIELYQKAKKPKQLQSITKHYHAADGDGQPEFIGVRNFFFLSY